MKYAEWGSLYRQKVDYWLPGVVGEGEMGIICRCVQRFFLGWQKCSVIR